MNRTLEELNDSQKDVILDLNNAFQNLFSIFVRVDEEDIPIVEALEIIGMEVPLMLRPAVNQLSGKLKKMKKEALSQELE